MQILIFCWLTRSNLKVVLRLDFNSSLQVYKINPPSLHLSFLCEYRVILAKPLKDMGRDGCKLEHLSVVTKDMLFRISGVRGLSGAENKLLGCTADHLGKCSEIFRWAGCLYSNILVGALHIFTYFYLKHFWKICILTHCLFQLVLKPTVFITFLRQTGIPKQQLHILVVLETYEVEPHIVYTTII